MVHAVAVSLLLILSTWEGLEILYDAVFGANKYEGRERWCSSLPLVITSTGVCAC